MEKFITTKIGANKACRSVSPFSGRNNDRTVEVKPMTTSNVKHSCAGIDTLMEVLFDNLYVLLNIKIKSATFDHRISKSNYTHLHLEFIVESE